MPLKIVSGEVQSQDINDNNSYLENKISQVNGGPFNAYNTVTDLTKEYPNGREGFAVIEGHSYWWNGNSWVDRGVYQAISTTDFSATNVVKNGNASNRTDNWFAIGGTITASSPELIYTVTSTTVANRIEQTSDIAISGHKYYLKATIIPKYGNLSYIRIGDNDNYKQILTTPNIENTITDIAIAKSTARFRCYHSLTTGYKVGDTIKFKYLLAWDLTATYGAGNEPNSVEEVDSLFKNLSNGWFDGTKAPLISNSVLVNDINELKTSVGIVNKEEIPIFNSKGQITELTIKNSDGIISKTQFFYTGNNLTKTIETNSKNIIETTLFYDSNNNFLKSDTKVSDT